MAEHPIKDLMTTAMENLKQMIDVNTIIGDPVETPDGGIVLTVSKVGFGFAAGGSEFTGGGSSSDSQSGSSLPFGGGSGGGVSITPVAFLVINKDGVQMLHLQQKPQFMERLLEIAPMAAEKIQQIMNESGQSQNSKQQKNKDNNSSNSSKQSENKEQNSDKEDQSKDKNSENKDSDKDSDKNSDKDSNSEDSSKDSKDEKDKKKSELDFDI